MICFDQPAADYFALLSNASANSNPSVAIYRAGGRRGSTMNTSWPAGWRRGTVVAAEPYCY